MAEWQCDRDGQEIDTSSITPYQQSEIHIVDEIKKLSQPPRLISGGPHVSTITSDTRASSIYRTDPSPRETDPQVVVRLLGLIQDTQEAFRAVLERNTELESEVITLRARLQEIESGPRNRYHPISTPSELTPLPLRQNWEDSSSLNIFDISTPPTYKENLKPRTREVVRIPANPNRRPNSLSAFNS